MNNKITIITYPSTITLNVNVLSAPMKRHAVAKWMRKQTYVVYKRLTLDQKTDTYTESKGIEKGISQKWKHTNKKSWSSNTYTRQNRL